MLRIFRRAGNGVAEGEEKLFHGAIIPRHGSVRQARKPGTPRGGRVATCCDRMVGSRVPRPFHDGYISRRGAESAELSASPRLCVRHNPRLSRAGEWGRIAAFRFRKEEGQDRLPAQVGCENMITLYHGSNVEVRKPQILKPNRTEKASAFLRFVRAEVVDERR